MQRLKRPGSWTIGAIVTAVLGSYITLSTNALDDRLSESDPLESVVVDNDPALNADPPARAPARPGPAAGAAPSPYGWEGFEILVRDRSRLPSDIARFDHCADLWRIAEEAGGIPLPQTRRPDDVDVSLKASANEGVTIVAVRAKVLSHRPTPDGALLACPPPILVGAPAEPVKVELDFRNTDLSVSDEVRAAQFDEGYAIHLAKDEPVRLTLDPIPSVEDVAWHVEVDMVVGGRQVTEVVDDGGRPFRTPGHRRYDDYSEGHTAGEPGRDNGPPLDWGVDKTVGAVDGRLDWGGLLTFPAVEGVDIYIPYGSGNGYINQYRQVRLDGRPVLSFNPPDVSPQEITRSERERCWIDDRAGEIRSVDPERVVFLAHGDQQFEHHIIDYRCNAPGDTQRRDSEDFRSPDYWSCDGSPCPEEGYRSEWVRRSGSPIVIAVDIDGPATARDRQTAGELLHQVQDNSV